MKLAFLANARLPTEKAHGHAIVKTCEAFAALGADVELWHPRRHQPDRELRAGRGQDILRFYGVDPGAFRVRTLRNADVVRLEGLPIRSAYSLLFVLHELVWGLRVAVRARRSQVDVCMTREASVAWCVAVLGGRVVLDVHVVPAGARRILLRRLVRRPAAQVQLVALTSGNRDGLVTLGADPDRVLVLGSAVDVRAFTDLPPQEECRKALGLPLDRPIVGYVGRFETFGEDKGIPQLVRATAAFAGSPTWAGGRPYLVCVGGPMGPVARYRRLAAEVGLGVGDVRFVDHVPAAEVPRWIRSLDVGVALYPDTPYGREFTSPLKVLEYQAAGVPIVASDLPAIREAVGGAVAAFVGSDDEHDVARALERLAAAPAAEPVTPLTWEGRARAVLRALGARADAR